MWSWVRRHGLTVLVLVVATWATSAGLDHHSPIGDWILREASYILIAAVVYVLCTAYAEPGGRFMNGRPSR